ncbi:hypothetical protein [Nocardioides zeae]|uniref:Uncharacterized protein n=1 Tax=Nocardioides zeae TaxID=1457234 RepID=A0A6P0HRR1_9ACTN|nr:hypothetical protein [Nocardioides zeae]NEN80687.1 hypothetical protein [Nocardioides zeae]
MDTTTPNPPTARTALDLRAGWQQLLDPPDHEGHSLWVLVVDGETRRLTSLLHEVADLPAVPATGDAAQLERFLAQLAASVLRDRHRVAVALRRRGGPLPDETDLWWIATVYEACDAVGAPCETVHLVGDAGAFPVTRAEVRAARAAQRSRAARSSSTTAS